MEKWYARPVMFVADLERAIRFYVDVLGFKQDWNYGEADDHVVVQLSRGNCEIIFAVDKERTGKGRLFISLENDEMARLREEIETRSIPVQHSWWGYEVLVIVDPDGNELMFPTDL